jgi:hypothetical protein
MDIDPNNANIVLLGTQNDGLLVTRDGGQSWARVEDVPRSNSSAASLEFYSPGPIWFTLLVPGMVSQSALMAEYLGGNHPESVKR